MQLRGIRRDYLVALVVFGVLMFNYPLLSLFNSNQLLAGFPAFFVYLFTLWGLLILLVMLVMRDLGSEAGSSGRGERD